MTTYTITCKQNDKPVELNYTDNSEAFNTLKLLTESLHNGNPLNISDIKVEIKK